MTSLTSSKMKMEKMAIIKKMEKTITCGVKSCGLKPALLTLFSRFAITVMETKDPKDMERILKNFKNKVIKMKITKAQQQCLINGECAAPTKAVMKNFLNLANKTVKQTMFV